MFVDHSLEWNNDWILDPSGDVLIAVGLDRVRQFIERRILTTPLNNPVINFQSIPDYLFDVNYGIGAGALVDQMVTSQFRAVTQQVILQGIKQEPGVSPFPAPTVSLFTTPGGLFQILAAFFVPPYGQGKVAFQSKQ